jgi:hypothetical protein
VQLDRSVAPKAGHCEGDNPTDQGPAEEKSITATVPYFLTLRETAMKVGKKAQARPDDERRNPTPITVNRGALMGW